jgi:hypothetical protein
MASINRLVRGACLAVLWLAVLASSAHAHGGIAGPDELGPPVITSALLGIACYWIVVLWPSRKPPKTQVTGKPIRRRQMKVGAR